MSNKYVAVVRRSDDDLQHWKYIKRIKTASGKWRYIYDDSELKKYEQGLSYTRADGAKVSYKVNKDRVYDGTKTITVNNKVSTETHELGKRSIRRAKAERWVYDKVLNSKNKNVKKAVKAVDKTASKGKKRVENLIKPKTPVEKKLNTIKSKVKDSKKNIEKTLKKKKIETTLKKKKKNIEKTLQNKKQNIENRYRSVDNYRRGY